MSTSGHRRRWPWALAAAAMVVLVAAVVVDRTVIRDRARAVTSNEAVDRFRLSTTTAPATTVAPTSTTLALRSLPTPGVYRYATDGEESVDVLGGATHRYPSETTITVTPEGCGVLFRWDALEERRDEWRLCATAAGLVQGTGLQFHEFFGQPKAEDVTCPDPPVMLPTVAEPGRPVEVGCTLGSHGWVTFWQVIGRETRTVAGAAVDTVDMRQSVDDSAAIGEQSSVEWYLDDRGLPVSVTATKRSTSSSPIGTVLYTERYTLTLESLTPER